MSRRSKPPLEQRLHHLLTAAGPRHGYARSLLHTHFAGCGPGELVRASAKLIASGRAREVREARPGCRWRHYLYGVPDDALAAEVRVILLSSLLKEGRT